MRKVYLYFFFTSETSEKMHWSNFLVKISVHHISYMNVRRDNKRFSSNFLHCVLRKITIWKMWEHLYGRKTMQVQGIIFLTRNFHFSTNDNWISRENSPHEYKCRSMLTVFFLQVQKHIMCSELHYHLTSFPDFQLSTVQ